jgi:hypothetical protein
MDQPTGQPYRQMLMAHERSVDLEAEPNPSDSKE